MSEELASTNNGVTRTPTSQFDMPRRQTLEHVRVVADSGFREYALLDASAKCTKPHTGHLLRTEVVRRVDASTSSTQPHENGYQALRYSSHHSGAHA
jgi:hypothetical protein